MGKFARLSAWLALAVVLVIAVFGYLALQILKFEMKVADRKFLSESRLEAAQKAFNLRCAHSGVRITKTVTGVKGILLMKIRPDDADFSSQFALIDPYGNDLGGDGYIETFLKISPRVLAAYQHVDATDGQDETRYRYTIARGAHQLDRRLPTGPTPRYGVTYEDISTPEDRALWIAGSSLKVIDLPSNEVIAERVGYMMDPWQGITAGGRSPWLLAADYACPSFHGKDRQGVPAFTLMRYQTVRFVQKVLIPTVKQEE